MCRSVGPVLFAGTGSELAASERELSWSAEPPVWKRFARSEAKVNAAAVRQPETGS